MTYTDDFGYTEYTEYVPDGRPGFARLLGDCARMAPHWAVPAGPRPDPVAPSQIHGISVPPASARLIAATAAYGDV
ncbi:MULTISPECIES: hypothetical protein [unclassified Streptomyces]|uniref:hypothetical protein n=1 Tax=unclassified Streptomyces TaxID=2593676 RepID=UPI00224EECC9|nr:MULTISPECIES: hypothetical protein [unclassified Streptomyces]MCX4525507.1 hypothetical protein [Streptomyces sp. NBC_01551]MCX4544021.1 hypothetical protein [Streptomyces sp. NBC_01565]